MLWGVFSPKIRRWLGKALVSSSAPTELSLEHPTWRWGTLVGCSVGSLAFALAFLAEAPDAGTPDRVVYTFGTLTMLLFALVLWRWSTSIGALASIVIDGSGAFFVYRLTYLLYVAPPGVDIPKEMTESLFWIPVVYLLGYLIPNLTLGRTLAFTFNLLLPATLLYFGLLRRTVLVDSNLADSDLAVSEEVS